MKNLIRFLLLSASLILSLNIIASNNSQLTKNDNGSFEVNYRNIFKEAGYSENEIASRLNKIWEKIFYGKDNEKLYYPADSNKNGNLAYIKDIGNKDVRSEGMSYGMMICVQMDKQKEFNSLWNWAKTYMQHQEGARKGYFAWHCNTKGKILDKNPASDGEEYFAMALFFASGRWGNGTGIYNYQKEANNILNTMLHKEEMNAGIVDGVTNMFNKSNYQIVFVPCGDAAKFTDPSYHLPAFYELWSQWADGYNDKYKDRKFWKSAAVTSRSFFTACTNPDTALNPDYANFYGSPTADEDHKSFRFDAWRTAMNWSLDFAWFGKNAEAQNLSRKLQNFFRGQGINKYGNQYSLDGKTEFSSDHSPGLIAMNAVTSLTEPNILSSKDFVDAFWDTPLPTGKWRYYDGMLYFLSYLILSGNYNIYQPSYF